VATPSPGGTLLGASQLQTAIDLLTTRVQELTTAIKNMRQGGAGSGPSSNWNANPNGGGSGTNNAPLFPRPASPPPSPYSAAQPGRTPYGYNPTHAAPYTTPTPGGTGPTAPSGPRPLLNQIAGFGSASGRLSGGAATVAAGVTGLASAATMFGKQQFSNQIGMNAYAQQASLAAPTSMTFGQINAQLYGQAFGGNGNTPWATANNTMDAAQGQLYLNAYSGTYNPSSTGQGRNISGAAGAFGYINPTLGLTKSAQMAGQLYAPQTSMMMRSLGYPVTPRVLGRPGQTNSAGAVVQGMMQRMFQGRSSIPQKALAQSLAPGQTGNIDLQQVFGQNTGAWTTTMEAYNRAAQKGMGQAQFSSLLNQAVQNKGGAQQTLAKKGILDTSDLQSIKDLGAQKTARASDYSSSYNSALQTSVGLLTQFNKQLSQMLVGTGMNKVLGGIGGVSGSMSNLTSMGAMGAGIGGAGMLLKGVMAKGLLSKVFGGGSKAAGAAGDVAGRAEGAAGGGALGAVGAAAAPVAGGLSIGMLIRALSDASAPKGTAAGRNSNALQGTGIPGMGLLGGFGGKMISMISGGGGAAASPKTAQSPPNPGKKAVGGNPSGAAVDAVHVAEKYLGTPYVWGGSSPSTGFDCSGLVQYAYGQAGVKLPRTSEQQWAFLRKRAVSGKNAREGDLVFAAGVGDGGTPNNPGHVGMMVNNTQLIEAPSTGQNVKIIRYVPGQWSHVARPSGGLAGGAVGSSGGAAAQLMSTGSSTTGGVGNSGGGFNSSESGALQTGGEAGGYGASGGTPGSGSGKLLGSAQKILGGPTGTGAGGTGSGKGGPTTKNLSGNRKIMNAAAAKFGWGTGKEWAALNTLEMHEAGYNNTIKNPTSTAYGMGQFLDTTWATVGGHKTSDPTLQANYMMKYIKQKYNDPIHAWAQYYNHPGGVGWYAKGTANAYKGTAIVGENGPELVTMRGGENVANAAQTSSIMGHHQMPAVNITIQKGAINIHGGGGSNAHDAGTSGREVVKQFLAQLSSENIYAAIGVGQKL
jgi:cell wall-associated NlpC family hydrolase